MKVIKKLCSQFAEFYYYECAGSGGERGKGFIVPGAGVKQMLKHFSGNFSSRSKSKSVGQKSRRGTSYQDTVAAMPFMSSECGSACLVFCAVVLMLPSSHPSPEPLPLNSPPELFY